MSADLVARMRSGREQWIELDDPPRRALKLRRPQLVRLLDMGRKMTGIQVRELTLEHVADWRGFTEADLLGAAIGAGDVLVPFEAELFREWIGDQVPELQVASGRLMQMVTDHSKQSDADRKNSATS